MVCSKRGNIRVANQGSNAMHNVEKLIAIVLAAALSALLATAAQAQTSFRTFVSGTGSDTGTCGVAAPCRSFAYALGETSVGGEIVVLSSAGYGPVTINQAVTISNPGGVEAGITGPSSGNAITITATVMESNSSTAAQP